MSPRRMIQTDVSETEVPDDVPETVPDGCPRDGGSRRMSLRRRIQTEVSQTDDQGGLAQRLSLRWKVQMGGPNHLGFPSQGHPCVPSALALRLETDVTDGCP